METLSYEKKYKVTHLFLSGKADIEVICPHCQKRSHVKVYEADWMKWVSENMTTPVYKAFPYLDSDERELLISGYCAQCWDEIFKGCEEDE